jgi:hypothetical protein
MPYFIPEASSFNSLENKCDMTYKVIRYPIIHAFIDKRKEHYVFAPTNHITYPE